MNPHHAGNQRQVFIIDRHGNGAVGLNQRCHVVVKQNVVDGDRGFCGEVAAVQADFLVIRVKRNAKRPGIGVVHVQNVVDENRCKAVDINRHVNVWN